MTTPSAHLASHQHALPGRTSPSRRNNYHAEDLPTQPRFLQWARNPFTYTRNSRIDEGVELHERRTEGADVSLGQATPVSSFLFPYKCSTLHISCRGTTRRRGQRWRKRKHITPNLTPMSQRNFSNNQRQLFPLMMVVMLLKLLQSGTERYVLLWHFFF
jgi:hypothetical protein